MEKKKYNGFIFWVQESDQIAVQDVVRDGERLAFDCMLNGIRYTVSLERSEKGDYYGIFSYRDAGKEETGPVSGKMFTRQDGSFLFYGSWIEENRRFSFVVDADET